MRGMAGDAECFGGAAVDLQTLEDENQRLKQALNKASEELRKHQVHRVRLEGELLRADGRVEVLLAELEQAPGQRWGYYDLGVVLRRPTVGLQGAKQACFFRKCFLFTTKCCCASDCASRTGTVCSVCRPTVDG